MKRWLGAATLLIAAFALPAAAQFNNPEMATGRSAKRAVEAQSYIAVTANPYATRAATEILAAGGSAVDAAVAAQLVLNLVEPQSSGLGGGAFLLVYDAKSGKLETYDGRETAPAASTPDEFLQPDGRTLTTWEAIQYGRAVAVPGLPALLETAQRAHGTLEWKRLFEPATRLAETGFEVSPRLATMLTQGQRLFDNTPDMRAYFYHGNGTPLRVGEIKTNPEFAATLRTLAAEGVEPFYRGAIGRALIAKLHEAASGASGHVQVRMNEADLANYRVQQRPPLCGPYRVYILCGMGMPSAGHATVLEALGMLERFDLASLGPKAAGAWHLIAEASRRAFADRDAYMADSDFVHVPLSGLLDKAYLAARAAEIDPSRVTVRVAKPGTPAGIDPNERGKDRSLERPGTTHLSIVDSAGNIVAMTSSIETAVGSRLMVGGFLLNNHMTDFSLAPTENGKPVANRIEPGKRPRSSMDPTIVFDQARHPVLVLGSPGGSAIPGYLLKTLVARLDWKMGLQQAIDLGHLLNRNGATVIEANSDLVSLQPALTAMGHDIRVTPQPSGIHAIAIEPNRLIGAADPRREGLALGR